jgi:hypothetical protein
MQTNTMTTLMIIFLWSGIIHAQGTFVKRTVDVNFQGACSVFSTDLNNDGFRDIMGAASGSNQVAWWENNGAIPPQFTKHLIDDSFSGAIYVYSDDVNGDSAMDVLGAAWYGNEIALWTNDGGNPVSWTKQVIDAGFTQAHEVKTADLDGMGGIDILAASAGKNEIAWWQNNGGNPIAWTKFTISSSVSGARSVFPADIDQDMDLDVIGAAFTGNEIVLFRNDGGNPVQWTQQTVDNSFSGAHWVYACDMDQDGDIDILGAAYISRDIAIWYNDGGNPIQWTKFILETNLTGALSVIAMDLNGDTLPDVVAAGDEAGDVIIWYNQGTPQPSFTKCILDSNFPGAWPVHACDLDGDADNDILAASSTMNTVVWWDNQQILPNTNEFQALNKHDRLRISPNPFISRVRIHFNLQSIQWICLRILSISGQTIYTQSREKAGSGENTLVWNGKNDYGIEVDNGVYICVLEIEGEPSVSRLLIKQ